MASNDRPRSVYVVRSLLLAVIAGMRILYSQQHHVAANPLATEKSAQDFVAEESRKKGYNFDPETQKALGSASYKLNQKENIAVVLTGPSSESHDSTTGRAPVLGQTSTSGITNSSVGEGNRAAVEQRPTFAQVSGSIGGGSANAVANPSSINSSATTSQAASAPPASAWPAERVAALNVPLERNPAPPGVVAGSVAASGANSALALPPGPRAVASTGEVLSWPAERVAAMELPLGRNAALVVRHVEPVKQAAPSLSVKMVPKIFRENQQMQRVTVAVQNSGDWAAAGAEVSVDVPRHPPLKLYGPHVIAKGGIENYSGSVMEPFQIEPSTLRIHVSCTGCGSKTFHASELVDPRMHSVR